jgi:hypothetical protein
MTLFKTQLCSYTMVGVFVALLIPSAAFAQGLLVREGTCANTQIAALEHRLQSGRGGPFVKGSGSAIRYTNGILQVSYEEVREVGLSRIGDLVTLCLIQIPRGCPAGDARGRIYTATNLRTMSSWTMADSEHGCGGA